MMRAELALKQGVSRLEIRSHAAGTFIRLGWRRPTWLEMAPLEQAADLDTTLVEFRQRERSALHRALLLGMSWALAALVFVRLASAVAGWRAVAAASLRRHLREASVRRSLALGVSATLLVLLAALRRGAGRAGRPARPCLDGRVHDAGGERGRPQGRAVPLALLPAHPAAAAGRPAGAPGATTPRLDGLTLLDAVDRDLYVAWAIAAGLLVAAIHRWLHQLIGPRAAFLGRCSSSLTRRSCSTRRSSTAPSSAARVSRGRRTSCGASRAARISRPARAQPVASLPDALDRAVAVPARSGGVPVAAPDRPEGGPCEPSCRSRS